jgi:hypothetical protein
MTCPAMKKLKTGVQFYCPPKTVILINKERIEKLIELNWHKAFGGIRLSKTPPLKIQFYQFCCFSGGQEFLLAGQVLGQLFTRNF